MAFDGFITKAIVTELQTSLVGSKVNKIFVPNKTEVVLSLYNLGNNYSLSLCSNPDYCRISLTTQNKPNPQNAYNFCMLLRKYLIGARITSISSYDLERTVCINFECYNELNDLVNRKLYIEIMSRQSNVILTNESNIIIDTLRRTDTSSRELSPAHEYTFVPSNKSSFIELDSFDIFKDSIESNKTIIENLTEKYIGFSKPLINESLNLLNIDNKNYNDNDLEKIYNYFKNLINSFNTNNYQYKYTNNDKDYTIILNENNTHQDKLYLNNFLDTFYFQKEQHAIFTNSRNNLLKIASNSLKKINKKLDNINSKLKECDNMDKFKLYGELLTANLYKLDNNANVEEVQVENYYDNNNLITIPLDKSIGIQKNVEKFFKRYNKLKNALSICTKQKIEAEAELDYISSIVYSLSSAKTLKDINEVYEEIAENVSTKKEIKKSKQNVPKTKQIDEKDLIDTTIIDGYTIYIGKNNIQNDYLSLKLANPNDVWFHTQKIHGSHVLLRNSENQKLEEIPENVLFNCAKLAKQFSKANNSLNIPVDYTYARYVKKAPGSRPGMVIYNNFKTIIVK